MQSPLQEWTERITLIRQYMESVDTACEDCISTTCFHFVVLLDRSDLRDLAGPENWQNGYSEAVQLCRRVCPP
jgi:hypothetical protein